ncbi:MAG: hypothetical protein WC682_04785 [Parcubacteria group bacterium]|jgi:hypothetical protein
MNEIPENTLLNSREKLEKEYSSSGAEGLLDFFEKEYFDNFLNKLDEVSDENVFNEIKEKSNVDVIRMMEYIDSKMPILFEKIKDISDRGNTKLIVGNSLKDVLGNSITAIFRTILKTAKNFDNPDIQEKIKDPNSTIRKILATFSQDVAEYYINALCDDDKKLELELNSSEGFLGEFKKYFKVIPTGSVKAIYFRFFSELKKGNIDENNIEEELNNLNEDIIDKGKLIAEFKNNL